MGYRLEKNRAVYEEDGKELGEVVFPAVNISTVRITHTFVDESIRGRKIASGLMETAAKSLRETGRRALPQCSYAVKWFEDHPEYSDILAE